MKKVHRMIRILAVVSIVLLSMVGCNSDLNKKETGDTVTGQAVSPVSFEEESQEKLSEDIEKQLQVILDNKKKWMKSEDKSLPYLKYAVTDLDQNGRLEIIACTDRGAVSLLIRTIFK